MITGILSFVGVIIGASLQYFFSRHIENQRHLRDLRSKSYMDYLKCVCEHAQLKPLNDSEAKKLLFTRTADAKARICLYGSSEAISSFALFEKLGATMNTPEQKTIFTNMVAIMRSDSGSRKCQDETELQHVLLGIH